MSAPRIVLLGCAVALASATDAQQAPADLQPGHRVRIMSPTFSRTPVVGTLKSIGEEELVLERTDGSVTLRRDSVVALEKSLGRRSLRSTRILGAALGGAFAVGSLWVCPAICRPDGAGGCLPCRQAWQDYAGVAAGAAAGFGLGSLFKEERWEKVGAPTLALEAAPTRRGARVALRFSF